MKFLFSMLFLFSFFAGSPEVINEFHQLMTEKEEKLFVAKYKDVDNASIQAYVCAIEMKQAEYPFNPIKKLKIFNETRKKLDLLIKENPSNIDLRYIRLFIQEQTPGFLGYNTEIEEDKLFLMKKIMSKEVSDDLVVYIYKNTSI